MEKVTSLEEIANQYFHDGMTVMIGGFLGTGTPELLVNKIIEKGVKDLTLIASDTAMPESGVGPLIVNRLIKKAIVTHIGTNPVASKQLMDKEISIEFLPQGTLLEKIRAGGSGLGGVLSPTGIGTVVEEGKQKIKVGDKEYLLELPLRADVALIKAYRGDRFGNLVYRNTARNFNPVMSLAADIVIAEVEELVEVGELDPNQVITPGILVNKIIVHGGQGNV
ncbi:3-oxoacid CoA-transferase subunit A [Bacillus sp. 1NLA3E]|uniref:3-oxoacid CoA-transferase subunit A n=1 Tax=Bacillus sp. 1NLA3E TaxID=666686 RepID=UPI000247EAC6|nr:3-oxoacid CoA-transferase subunit A [Bacillus sp. 1NLA3E]AGK53396.1 acetoacetyl-CoA transferase, alpha subunit [Bacillus sp. 1NLA3E]